MHGYFISGCVVYLLAGLFVFICIKLNCKNSTLKMKHYSRSKKLCNLAEIHTAKGKHHKILKTDIHIE